MKPTVEMLVIAFLLALPAVVAVWFGLAMADEVQAIADVPLGAAIAAVLSLGLAVAMIASRRRRRT